MIDHLRTLNGAHVAGQSLQTQQAKAQPVVRTPPAAASASASASSSASAAASASASAAAAAPSQMDLA